MIRFFMRETLISVASSVCLPADGQLAADGVELEARTAWMHEMYRAMLNTLKE